MEKRKVWFVTRPERDVTFHKDALECLKIATNNFSVQWEGNKTAHKKFEKELISKGLKRNNISKDGSSGRTWCALLKTFCYCYVDKNNFLVITKVGKAVLDGIDVKSNVIKQMLTLQIPNAYFLGKGFKPKFDDDFEIMPIRFLIKLCVNQKLNYCLTKEEITFFVMTAHKNNEYNKITQDILKFRNSNEQEKEHIKNEIAIKYEHRQRCDNIARNFEKANRDTANSFMLAAEYTELVKYERGNSSKLYVDTNKLKEIKVYLNYYESKYPFNNRYQFSLERMAETNGLDIKSYKASRLGNIKPSTNLNKKINKAKSILSNKLDLSYDEKVNLLSKEFTKEDANELAQMFSTLEQNKNLTNNFIKKYLSPSDDLDFENKTGELLKLIGFNIQMHPPVKGKRTEIDILLKYKNNLCGIIDAKHYKDTFLLSANLASHMASEYIPNYLNYENKELKFFGYVAYNKISGEKNLNVISNKVDTNLKKEIKGFMINSKSLIAFLDYCIENNITKDNKIDLFLKLINNTQYTNFGDVKDALK